MRCVEVPQRGVDRLPGLGLFGVVRHPRNRLAMPVLDRDIGKVLAARAVDWVVGARVVGLQRVAEVEHPIGERVKLADVAREPGPVVGGRVLIEHRQVFGLRGSPNRLG